MKQIVTAEEWLREAVEQLDRHVFDGELGIGTRQFQIYYGRVRGRKGSECVLPSDVEDITLEDFFPITIGVDYQIRDIHRLMEILAFECIKAFLGVSKGKRFKKTCDRFYFEAPYTEPNPSPYLRDMLDEALEATIKSCGEFPGKAVKFPTKPKSEKKSSKVVFFCPECGLELAASKKMLKNNQGTPTCICGAKMGRDNESENTEQTEAEENTEG